LALPVALAGSPAPATEATSRATLRVEEGKVLAVTFSPDGKSLACGVGKTLYGGRLASWAAARDPFGEVQLWDVATGRLRARLRGHTRGVASLAFTADGKTLASVSWDHTAKLWDLPSGKLRATLKAPDAFSVVLTRDGKFLGAPGFGGNEWNTSSAISPDHRLLAEGSWDGWVKVWDVRTAKWQRTSDQAATVLEQIGIWDVRAAKLQHTLKGPLAQVWSVAFAPNGKALAAAYEDGTVVLWDPASGKERSRLRHPARVKPVAFAPDGKTLAAGCKDGTVRLWDVAAGKERAVLKGHEGPVTGLAFAPDGETLAAAGGPEVKLWDLNLTKK
jgi:WD40 repeat protein